MAKKILIVEDNELNMKLFNDLLQAHGYETLQSKDGKEALKLARDNMPDLILRAGDYQNAQGRPGSEAYSGHCRNCIRHEG